MRSSIFSEGEINSQNEDDMESQSASARSVVEAEDVHGESSHSQGKSSSKKKKTKSKCELLEEKWSSKFSELDTKLDSKLDSFFTMFRNELQKSGTANGDNNSERNQQSQRHVGKSKRVSQRHSKRSEVSDSEESENQSEAEDDIGDRVSLQRGQEERNELGEESDNVNEVQFDEENLSEKAKKCLFDIFGEDAIAKKTEQKTGIEMDNSQKEVLMGHWRAKKPNLITAFAEETREVFPVDEETETFLQVTSLDDLIGRCLVKKFGNKASFSKSGKSLVTQPFKMLEKIAYRGQQAAFVGIVINMYIQQGLGSLIQTLSGDNVYLDKAVQQIRDIFAMSTKSLDQMGRMGAFHHILRRQMCMTDTSLYQVEDCRDISDLPLTRDGVFGEKLESFLKSRKEKNKALEDLIPDFFKSDRKRKSSSEEKGGSSAKKSNVQAKVNKENPSTSTGVSEGFRIPKKGNQNFPKKDGNFNRKPADGKQPNAEAHPKNRSFPPRGEKAKRL